MNAALRRALETDRNLNNRATTRRWRAPTFADGVLANATALGLDVRMIAEQLQAEAITAFATSFDKLLGTVEEKRRHVLPAAR